jgi:hypothetical protein
MGDISITPRWDFLPAWVRELFASAVGTSVAVGLVICVVGFVITGVMLIFARSQGMYGMGAAAKTRVLEVVVATIVIAGAVSLVGWFASKAESSPQESSDQGEGIDAMLEVGRDSDAAHSPSGTARLLWVAGS